MGETAEAPEMPSGFAEVNHSEKTVVVDRKDMPWLPKDQQVSIVPLVAVKLKEGKKFFLGSAIKGKRLVEAADQLDDHRSAIANNLLYSHLPPFLSGDRSHMKSVDDRVTERPIYGLRNPGGQRVYFMQFDNIEGVPVIIRIAACDKAKQDEVLTTISTSSRSEVKKRGKL